MTPSSGDGGAYRVQEFAKLAGVTVRTLHHYDRVGLLKPRRTRASYRVYRDSDLPRLHQILVLKFLGVALADIADALKRPARLEDLLKTRQYAVKRKRARLDIEQHMLDEALRLVTERRIALNVTLEEYELHRDVRAAIARGETPDTPGGEVIVARWRAAIARFVGGDPKLRDALVLVMEAQGQRTDSAYRVYFDRALRSAGRRTPPKKRAGRCAP